MNINIICVGKIKERFFTDAINEYTKRISRFCKISIVEVKDEKIPENPSDKECEIVKEKEGERILPKMEGGYNIALCIEGKELSSENLAKKMTGISMIKSTVNFIIGGSLGLCDAVKNKSDMRLSFGLVTLPHQLMRVVLLEQIYRAFKINNNESYHK